MVTTIKITCDGVFIQTNSYRSLTIDRNNNNANRINNNTNSAITNNYNNNAINGNYNNTLYISTNTTTVSSSPSSLPSFLLSSNTLPTSKVTNNKVHVATSQIIQKIGKSDKTAFGKCNRSDSNVMLIKEHCGKMTSANGIILRRRNTFKNYLIECKENLIRRLSSPTPLNGQ